MSSKTKNTGSSEESTSPSTAKSETEKPTLKSYVSSLPLISTLKQKFTTQSGVDEMFVHFLVLLYGVSTGEVTPQQVFYVGGKTHFGLYSRSFWQVYTYGVVWKYGIARASEIISENVETLNDNLSRFLLRLAQVIRLGDKLSDYFKTELELVLQNYYTNYQRKMESLKLLLGMYSAIMSISAFMISSTSILTMLTGSDATSKFILSLTGVVAALAAFVLVMFVIFPRDRIVTGNLEEMKQIQKMIKITVLLSVAIAAAALLIEQFPTTLGLAMAGPPLIIPGMKARKLESKVRNIDEWYPPFAKDFGQVYNTIGSVTESLRAIIRSDFNVITTHIRGLLNRALNKVPTALSFDMFSKETGSDMINTGNTVISNSIIKGADMGTVGTSIYNVFSRVNELRKIREQTTKTFVSMIYILHILTLAVFAFMTKLSFIFTDIFSKLEGNQNVFNIKAVDPFIANIMLPLTLVVLSIINAMAIKTGEGGLYRSAFFHLGIMLLIGGITLFGADFLLEFIMEAQNIGIEQLTG